MRKAILNWLYIEKVEINDKTKDKIIPLFHKTIKYNKQFIVDHIELESIQFDLNKYSVRILFEFF